MSANIIMKFAMLIGLAFSSAESDNPPIPWYQSLFMFHFPHFYALDIKGPELLDTVKHISSEYILIEFYATWCPHCQHFAPDFERLSFAAKQYNDGRTVSTANVDCVAHAEMCNEWGVDGFPTMFFGKKADWLSKNASKLVNVDVWPRSAETVGDWINNRIHSKLDLSKAPKSDLIKLFRPQASAKTVRAVRGDAWDVQVAVALMLHNALAQHAYPSDDSDGSRRALIDFAGVLARNFPESAETKSGTMSATPCRDSLVYLHNTLNSSWGEYGREEIQPAGVRVMLMSSDTLEGKWRLCGTEWSSYSKGWNACKGTWPGKRGYTCGLWTMFHSLAGRTTDRMAKQDLDAVRSAVDHFFECDECREHFMAIPTPQGNRITRQDSKIWWWNAHNVVNRRVKQVEAQYEDGDPEYPKVQWPSPAECPNCRLNIAAKPATSFLRQATAKPHRDNGFFVNPVDSAGARNSSSVGQRGDVGLEFPTVEEGVRQEGWELDKVELFLDRYYGGSII